MRAWLLRFFLGSIAINAAFGVWALLAGNFGQTESKVLATSLLVSAMTLSVLINSTAIQQRSLWPVPVLAAASAAGAFGLLIVFMWAEIDDNEPMKVVATALVVGASGSLAGLLQLIALSPSHERVRLVNTVLITTLALTTIWGIWAETEQSWYLRAVGVQSVLVAATTLAIPILWRFAGGDEPEAPPPGLGSPTFIAGQPISSLTSAQVVSVEPTATLRTVVDHLVDEGVTMVVVMDSNSVAGVLTDHDVVLAMHDGANIDEVRAAEVMSTSLVVVTDQATVAEAARQMSEQGVRHLLVQGDNSGIVSALDLLAALRPLASQPV